MKLKSIIIIGFALYSCKISKPVIEDTSAKIGVDSKKTSCGSWEITNNGSVIGYVTNPFNTLPEKRNQYINEFENSLLSDSGHKYNNFYRVYYFLVNRSADIILCVTMVSVKQTSVIKGWDCEAKGVDDYKMGYRNADFRHGALHYLYFNCTKKIIFEQLD